DLRASLKAGGKCAFLDVRSFAFHPEFKLWREGQPADPGTVRFSHAAHLAAEGVRALGGKSVKLDCASCHQPDADRRYMKSVNYEAHCAKCHPLAVQVTAALGE